MADITPPSAFEDAVQQLPPHQNPYGDKCALPRPVQDVMFHYGVHKDDVALLVSEGFDDAKLFREANPDGDEEQQQLYSAAVDEQIPSFLRRRKVKLAFRRLLGPDIYAAVKPAAPPAKKPKTAISSVKASSLANSDSSSSSSSSSAAPPPAASTSGVAPVSKGPSSASKVDDDSGEGDDDVADADKDDDKEDKDARTSSRNDLDSLFEDVKNEVRFSLCGVVVAPFRDSALLLHLPDCRL